MLLVPGADDRRLPLTHGRGQASQRPWTEPHGEQGIQETPAASTAVGREDVTMNDQSPKRPGC